MVVNADVLQYGALGLLYVIVVCTFGLVYKLGAPAAREHLKTYRSLQAQSDALQSALVSMGHRQERFEWAQRATLEMLADLHRAQEGPQRTSDVLTELQQAIANAAESHGGQKLAATEKV